MTSNNGLTVCKRSYLSFIDKGKMALLLCLLLIIVLPCFWFVFAYWSWMLVASKVISLLLLSAVLLGIIITPLNGMLITKKGTVLFFPDLRIKKTNFKELQRLAIVFNEWENSKYSATVRMVYSDGRIFKKDYSSQFRNMKNKKMAMSMYTITSEKVDRICKEMSCFDDIHITVIDKRGEIVYQKTGCHSSEL